MPSQVLLAWGMNNKKTIVIPKVSSLKHLKDNIESMKIDLSISDIDYITGIFKPKRMAINPEDIIPYIPTKEDKRKIYTNLEDAKKKYL